MKGAFSWRSWRCCNFWINRTAWFTFHECAQILITMSKHSLTCECCDQAWQFLYFLLPECARRRKNDMVGCFLMYLMWVMVACHLCQMMKDILAAFGECEYVQHVLQRLDDSDLCLWWAYTGRVIRLSCRYTADTQHRKRCAHVVYITPASLFQMRILCVFVYLKLQPDSQHDILEISRHRMTTSASEVGTYVVG